LNICKLEYRFNVDPATTPRALHVAGRFRSLVSARDRPCDPTLSSRRASGGNAAAVPGCSDRRFVAWGARAGPCNGA
jgi:hypothetical protein